MSYTRPPTIYLLTGPDDLHWYYATKAEAFKAARKGDKVDRWTVRRLPRNRMVCALLNGIGWADDFEILLD